jgi:probable rRNA maturation factor
MPTECVATHAKKPRVLANTMPIKLPRLALSLQFGAIDNAVTHRAALPRHWVMRCLRHALAHDAQLCVRVVNGAEGQALNQSYRQKNAPTNVLTFNYEQAPQIVADLVLCAPVVAKEALDNHKTLRAHYAHLLVHAALHAQGWDHETSEQDAHQMEAQEVQILTRLGIANPYGV